MLVTERIYGISRLELMYNENETVDICIGAMSLPSPVFIAVCGPETRWHIEREIF